MSGPIARVNTTTAGINLDVNRKLNWGKGLVMEFFVPDVSVVTAGHVGLRLVKTITKGFDRISGDEQTKGEGHTVIFQVALVKANVGLDATLGLKDLQVRVDDIFYTVGPVPPVPHNEAQVFTLTCKTRTKRAVFENK